MNETYKVVTISNRIPTQDYYTYYELIKSLGSHEPLILGQGENEYTGLSDKPRILYNAIKDGKIKEDIIIFVDAWDVVFAVGLDEVIAKYKKIEYSVVIGAEKNCYPNNFRKEFDGRHVNRTSYNYLNSGVIIGRTDAIMTILEAMDAPNLPRDYRDSYRNCNYHFNDQAYYMDIYLRQPVDIFLDKYCVIVQNMQDVEPHELEFLENGVIKNVETGTYPSIIHWNGGSKDKWSRELILKHLNLI